MEPNYCFGNQCFYYYGNMGVKTKNYNILAPEQSQDKQPGLEYLMTPSPIFDNPNYRGSGKLLNKVAVITGGDSGLGRAAAVAFVKEGAKVVIPYLDEHIDAEATKNYIEAMGGECLLLSGDIRDKEFSLHGLSCRLIYGKEDQQATQKDQGCRGVQGPKSKF